MERLEARLALASQPILTLPAPPTPLQANEGENVQVSFQFTDAVSTGSAQLPGLKADDYEVDPNPTDPDGVRAFDSTLYAGITSIVLNTSLAVPQMVVTYGGGLFTDIFYGAIEDDNSGPAATDRTPLAGNAFVSSAVEIAVFAFDAFTLGAGHIITAAAGSSRPVAILSQADLTVAGTINVSANGATAGPGGGAGGSFPSPYHGDPADGAPVTTPLVNDPANPFGRGLNLATGSGGGGGGFGGQGGNGTMDGNGANPNNWGGAGYGDLFQVIQGGSGGGAGRSSNANSTAPGGGGGGGIELGAEGQIEITGSVLANGAAGQFTLATVSVSGGGGAGGGILIHAEDVEISSTALLSAQGGNGGTSGIMSGFHGGGGGGGGHIAIAYTDSYVNSAPATAIDRAGGFAGSAVATAGQVGELHIEQFTPASIPETYNFVINWGDTSQSTGSSLPGGGITLSAPVSGVLTGSFSGIHTYADGDATYVITVTVTDAQGTAVDTFDITVANVDPMIAVDGPAAVTVNEGSVATMTGTWSDVAADTVTLSASRGTVTKNAGGTWNWSDSPADDVATEAVTITATDEDGGESFVTFDLTANNLNPTLTTNAAAVTVDEGSIAAVTGSWSDVPADVVALGASIGVVTKNSDGSWSWSYNAADDLPTQPVIITATDDDGGQSSVSFDVTVNNVAPIANAGGPYVTFDDLAITLNGSGSDVAGDADPLTYVWDFDGGVDFEITGEDPLLDPATLGVGQHTIRLKVTDGDGGEHISTTTVTILGKGTHLLDGILYVIGDKVCNDIALISQCDGNISVLATFNDNNPATFAAAGVTEIVVRARGGHDIVVTTSNVTHKMTFDGAAGNDLLVGGGGQNVMYGGTGHDTLYGGGAADMLFGGDGDDDLFGNAGADVLIGGNGRDIMDGGDGRDLLIGGCNEDRLQGGSSDDILIGGFTCHDDDVDALDAIMTIWTSSASFADRVATLTGSGGYLVPEVTVFDDGAADHLIGAAGRDLAFADTSMWDGVKDTISLSSAQDVLIAVNS